MDEGEVAATSPKRKSSAKNPPSKKVRLDFSGKEFRKSLQTGEKIRALLVFSQSIDSGQDSVLSYLQAGGSPLEILQLMEGESGVPPTIIFDIVNRILLHIGAKLPKYQNGAYDACRYLLSTHVSLINKMLGLSSNAKERVVTLKLLTTIVTFSIVLAKDILLHVNFNATNLELLTKASEGKDEVRSAFIHFICAFLVDGHFPTLSVLLEKKGFMTSIISGLLYDKADVVVLVLTTMKNHILENGSVSKTIKMKTFSTPVVRDIVNLYNWKGPAGLIDQKKKNRVIVVNEIDKSKVSDAVHAFLLVLCTSHKFGVIFKDTLLGLGKRQNSLMYTVLESLERPWEHSYAGELVCKICRACPDLTRTMWMGLKAFLEPRWTEKWLKSVNFAKRLLDELQPECIEFAVNNLNVHQLSQIITIQVCPLPVLKILLPENHTYEPSVKQHVLSLLLKMIELVESYINQSKSWPNVDSDILKTLLSNHIQRNFPDVSIILSEWDNQDDNLSVCEYLDTALDFLEKYKKLAPKMLDDTFLNFDLKDVLTKIETVVQDSDQRRLQVKAINFFLDLDSTQFRPKSVLFEMVISFSLEFYYDSKDPNVLTMLHRLLQNTGLFDGFLPEIDLWVDGILNLKSYDENVALFLCSLLKTADENLSNYITKLFGVKGANFSPLLLALGECLNVTTKPIKYYLSFVILNLFHLQVDSEFFIEVVSKLEFLPEDLIHYIQNSSKEITELPKLKGKLMEPLHIFSVDFLNNILDNCDFTLYPNLKRNQLQILIFYVTNLIKSDKLKENHMKNAIKFVSFLQSDDRYIGTILTNPTLLNHLTFFNSDDFSTKLILEVVKGSAGRNIEQYLVDLRRKLVSLISKVFRKIEKFEKTTIFIDVIETIALDYGQCRKLLEKFVSSIENKRFFPVACYCLNRISQFVKNDYSLEPLSDDTVKKLSYFLINLIEEQTPNLNQYSLSLLNYLEVFPHNIEGVDGKLFESLVTMTEFNKDNLSLCEFLLYRKTECMVSFEQNLDEVCSKRSFILSLLDTVVARNPDDVILEKIFKRFETHIVKALQKPHKAGQHFQKHYRSVAVLVEKFMEPKDFGSHVQKFETVELFHVYLLKKIYDKIEINEGVLGNMIMTFVHLLTTLLKQKRSDDLNEIGGIFSDLLHSGKKVEMVLTNESLKTFYKFCLKYGLAGDVILVKILGQLADFCIGEDDAKVILDMLMSHSQFLDVVLGDQKRDEILNLWLILCRKWPRFMERSHIPVILSAYSATKADKIILDLLKLYELNPQQTSFFDFKPFLWGRAAASHYSVRSDIQKVLWRQPKTADVLNNLHLETILATISNPQDPNSYDLDYFLPLFIHILSPENPVATYRFTKSGALALALTGFRGPQSQRLATCHVLQRFYFHLEAKQSGKDNPLWLRFIEAICKGVAVLEDFKINNFVAVFLARTALVLTDPTNVMYVPLTQYLSAKDSLDFSTIPELYTFLHSPHVESKEHKHWILEVLRDGSKDQNDFTTLLRSMGFKLISELCSSTVCDPQTKVLILQVFEACVGLNLGVKVLCGSSAFLAQVFSLVLNNVDDGVVLVKLFEILLKVVGVLDERHKNFVVYLNLVTLFEDDKFFRCLVESKGLDVFYHILGVVVKRYPEFFIERHYRILLEKSNDQFCKYLDVYGCRFVKESDISTPSNPNYLKLLFFNKIQSRNIP